MTGGSIHRYLILPSTLIGILISFCAWAIGWTLQARNQNTYQLGPQTVSIPIIDTNTNAPAESLNSQLHDLLKKHKQALIIDEQGNGRPAILLIDPANIVPWNTSDTSNTADNQARYLVLAGSFCHNRIAANEDCPLAPTEAKFLDIADPDLNPETLQYVYIPSLNERLPSGEYILSSNDSNLSKELLALLTANKYEYGGFTTPDLLLEVTTNPLVAMSALFTSGGLIATGIYWNLLLRDQEAELTLRIQCGALPRQIVKQILKRGAWQIVLGSVSGVTLSQFTTATLAEVQIAPEITLWLVLATLCTTLFLTFLLYKLAHHASTQIGKDFSHV